MIRRKWVLSLLNYAYSCYSFSFIMVIYIVFYSLLSKVYCFCSYLFLIWICYLSGDELYFYPIFSFTRIILGNLSRESNTYDLVFLRVKALSFLRVLINLRRNAALRIINLYLIFKNGTRIYISLWRTCDWLSFVKRNVNFSWFLNRRLFDVFLRLHICQIIIINNSDILSFKRFLFRRLILNDYRSCWYPQLIPLDKLLLLLFARLVFTCLREHKLMNR